MGSNSLKVARHLTATYESLGKEVHLLDLAKLPADAFSPQAYVEKSPALMEHFIEPVLHSQGLHVVVPEYNGSFPGVLKLFIDLLPFPESFDGRPVAFVGLAAGSYGGLRPVEQLQMVFAYRNAWLFNQRVFIPAVHKVLNESGTIVDADLKARLERQVTGFLSFADRLAPLPAA